MHAVRPTTVAITLLVALMLAEAASGDDSAKYKPHRSDTGTILLAKEEGIQGMIQVVERDGLRQLTINNVVQGAAPVSEGQILPGKDPLVRLVSVAWESAFVIRDRSSRGVISRNGRFRSGRRGPTEAINTEGIQAGEGGGSMGGQPRPRASYSRRIIRDL